MTGYNKFAAITTSDTVNLPPPPGTSAPRLPDAVYVGGAGTIALVDSVGIVTTLTAPVVGQVLPISPFRINATGTSATLLIALYKV